MHQRPVLGKTTGGLVLRRGWKFCQKSSKLAKHSGFRVARIIDNLCTCLQVPASTAGGDADDSNIGALDPVNAAYNETYTDERGGIEGV